MKIGIMTFHEADNYGAVLQAYGLKKACENLGHTACIVNYTPEYISEQYRYFSVSGNMTSNLLKLRNVFGNASKQKSFSKFRKELLDIVPFEKSDFDAILYGSDQIWNPNISGNFDRVFFGDNILKAKRNISYAASIGKQGLSENEKYQISMLLVNLDSISVREENARKLLENITDRPISVTLDPTLLNNMSVWKNIAKAVNNIPEKYIFLYEVNKYPQTMAAAHNLSKKTGLPIVELIYDKTRLFVPHVQINSVGPCEFISLINNASYVVTSSFHGTAFSVIFKKNFFTIMHHVYGSRMSDLLNSLGLQERIITENLNVIQDINYTEPEKKLDNLKQFSLDYIRNSLER